MLITVKDVPQLPYRTSNGLVLRSGNTIETDDYPDLSDAEVDAIYRAGFIEIEGREPSPDIDVNRRVLLQPENVKTKVAANG
jgi:hypothetical protein